MTHQTQASKGIILIISIYTSFVSYLCTYLATVIRAPSTYTQYQDVDLLSITNASQLHQYILSPLDDYDLDMS